MLKRHLKKSAGAGPDGGLEGRQAIQLEHQRNEGSRKVGKDWNWKPLAYIHFIVIKAKLREVK